MDPMLIENAFKSHMEKAEKSKRMNQRQPTTRPHRNSEQEHFRWRMMSMQLDMQKKQSADQLMMRTTIVSGLLLS